MRKVKMPKQVAEYIKNSGTTIVTNAGDRYYHLPDWFKETDQEDVFVVLQESELPIEVKESLRRMNEPTSIEEVPNWVIVNALRCPIESQISIVAKLLQHLDRDQINKALSMGASAMTKSETLDKIVEKWTDDAMQGGRRSDTAYAIRKAIEEYQQVLEATYCQCTRPWPNQKGPVFECMNCDKEMR